MNPLYFVFLGIAVLVFVGLLVYLRFFAKPQAVKSQAVGESVVLEEPKMGNGHEAPSSLSQRLKDRLPRWPATDPADDILALPTEDLIDVVGHQGPFLRTRSGDLVSILMLAPVVKNSSVSASAYDSAFADAIGALPQDMSLQVVSMPIPVQLGGLTERYAMAAYHWKSEQNRIEVEKPEEAGAMQNRYVAAMQIGSMIHTESYLANQRVSLLVLTRRGSIWNSDLPIDDFELSEFQTQIEQVQAIFETNHFPIFQIEVEESLEILWHAYNPEISTADHSLRSVNRFGELAAEGKSSIEVGSTLTMSQTDEALAEPKQGIPQLLAPRALEEGQASIQFNEQTMLLYYVVDYQSRLPTIERLSGNRGQFASRLFVSYFINIPTSDEIARQSRKASTAIQAKGEINRRMGALESYKQREELHAIEMTRYGAETEKDILRTLGLYVGVMVENENIREETAAFEAMLTSAGLRFVPANWNPLQVWKTMHPLGQRHHQIAVEDRNVFSSDLANLNPLPTVPYFDPNGEFLGFSKLSDNSTLPISLVRRRGKNIVPSEALVGAPGSGKSYALKQLVLDWIVRGHRVITLDPATEMREIVGTLGGINIDMLGAEGINLLHFEKMDLEPGNPMTKLMSDLVFDHNLASIIALYQSEKGGSATIDATEKRLFREALRQTMQRHEMDPRDPRTWDPNKIFLKDVYKTLVLEMRNSNPETVKLIQDALAEYCADNGYSVEKYNTPTELDLSNQFVSLTFGLESFKGDPAESAMAYHFATRLAMQQAVRSFLLDPSDRPTPFHIVIDEASQMLITPSLVQSVVRMLSVLQKYDIHVHLAFQDMKAIAAADSLLEESTGIRSSTNTLIGTIPSYWLFSQEFDSALLACELLRIPKHEAERISSQNVGQCTLVLGRSSIRIPLEIKAPPVFHDLFVTDAETMKANTIAAFN